MTHLSLFSGIGGIDLAAEWAGFRTVAFVERDKFCQKVLAKHWPGVPIYDDITTFDAEPFRGVDLVSGGFPCQDISAAGKQEGLSGDRSGLWFEMLRVIEQARPAWAVAENVANLVAMGIDSCLLGLESAGYSARTVIVPASAVGSVHKRERCFIIAANTECVGRSQISAEQRRQPSVVEMLGSDGSARGVVADSEGNLRRASGHE
jgi:DNA (cytosine-5)-methyltransferase 1